MTRQTRGRRAAATACICALVLANGLPAGAQDEGPVIIFEEGEPVVAAPAAAPAAVAAPAPDAAAVDTDALRLKRLLDTPFDRTPKAVLAAWSGVGIDVPPPPEAKPAPATPPDPFLAEVCALQSSVTTGDWAAVGSYLSGLPGDHGAQVHRHLCDALWKAADPRAKDEDAPMPQLGERALLSTGDVAGLAAAASPPVTTPTLDLLGKLVACAVRQGHSIAPLVSAWDAGLGPLGGAQVTSRVAVAHLLVAAARPKEAAAFVPALDAVREDPRALEVLARYHLARHEDEKTPAALADAWKATVASLALAEPAASQPGPRGDLPADLRQAALSRALSLAPKVGAELGPAWVADAFAAQPGRGRALLAVAGAALARLGAEKGREPAARLEALKAARGPIVALLERAPDDPAWRPALDALLAAWLREAEASLTFDTSAHRQRMPQWDDFGNLFFVEHRQMPQDPRLPWPIPCKDVLRVAPSDAWLERASPGLQAGALGSLAALHLAVDHPDDAFPFVERLAPLDRARGRELAHELLRGWTRAHDMNAEKRRNPYMYFYGFEQRADAIPLTRQKQERNLDELSRWVARVRALPIDPIEEDLVAEAFVRSHGAAEVYRLDAIRRVFGEPSACQPETLARIAQTMRGNLATVWRDPKTQEEQKTKRRDAEITAEVARGYEVACRLAADALAAHAGRWDLLLADAALRFDRNEFEHKETGASASFAPARADALAGFAAAAAAYAKEAPGLAEPDESLEPYTLWFNASLGACDLPLLASDDRPDLAEAAKVKDALAALPESVRARYQERFAHELFKRMSGVKPEAKFGYLRAGFVICGDHPAAREARDVFEYYQDLVREVQLVATIDGSDRVGHGRAFGVLVSLRHTKELERESGGFAKYLQNQNQVGFSYNYGRPTEDYRDKFQEGALKALGERFEVLSVTFHAPEVVSRGDRELGWRQTPYCYLLLRPKGPEVDQLPALELSMDFLDTSGFVILPVASAPVPLDARDPKGDPRPVTGLDVTLTLDERRAGDGVLALEVKAAGRGLVPDLDALLDLGGLPAQGFEVVKADDVPVSAVELRDDDEGVAIQSERVWTIELRGKSGQARLPTRFTFPPVKDDKAKLTRLRFVDADVVVVEPTVALEATYGSRARWPWIAGVAAVLAVLAGLVALARRAPPAVAASPWAVPARATPFTVLELLGRMRAAGAVGPEHRQALDEAVVRVERRHFAPAASTGESEDLTALARTWVERAR